MAGLTLYVECFSGISGDMTVGALLDLGADRDVLEKGLKSLNVEGYNLEITRVSRNGISACDFNVILETESVEGSENIPFVKRNISEIFEIIEGSGISKNAKSLSKKIFMIKAVAEAKAHRIDIADVHFHESGAVDSIVDIVASAICLDNLNIEEAIVSELHDGTGLIRCRKGLISVPVPAVVNIAAKHGLKIKATDIVGEMVTPTGAAIMAAIKAERSLPNNYRIMKTGYGAGKRDYPNEGVAKMLLIEELPSQWKENLWEI
jgi:uncharacterized protein (TIGR00299 family) protein